MRTVVHDACHASGSLEAPIPESDLGTRRLGDVEIATTVKNLPPPEGERQLEQWRAQ
jgi:hypothetical protein